MYLAHTHQAQADRIMREFFLCAMGSTMSRQLNLLENLLSEKRVHTVLHPTVMRSLQMLTLPAIPVCLEGGQAQSRRCVERDGELVRKRGRSGDDVVG